MGAGGANGAGRRPAGAAPVIGVSTYSVFADWKEWADHSALTPTTYLRCLHRAGAAALLIPSLSLGELPVDILLDRVDGIVLIGGEDVCGARSGREESEEVHERHSEERDAFEIEIVQRAWDRDLPILGICRGAQVLNVALGGTVVEDVFEAGGERYHRLDEGSFNNHVVNLDQGSLGSRLYGTTASVPSHHHQAVEVVADDLVVTGTAPDGVIEVVEGLGRKFVIGVQWHPEEGDALVLFEGLVEASRS